jgi:alkanesulfonate monooxygenase SsuD/methylene tetrahydromethanopterin reductase-like flavin-dependent oxidoreductase (luciferase family)
MTHNEGAGDPSRIYADTLTLFAAAEQLGFDAAWVAQHHFKERAGRLPSPFPFLAAASQRTTRLRLGTAVVLLPLEEPLRVAEDAAVVDALSGGRLELGIGVGGDPDEFDAFGRAPDDRHAATAAGLDLLRRAFCGGELGSRGQRLEPPAPALGSRMWQGVMSTGSAQKVAASGLGLMLARSAFKEGWRTDALQLPLVEAYLGAWNGCTAPPRVAVSRTIYPAADKQTALAEMSTAVLQNAGRLVEQGQLPAEQSLEQYCQWMNIAYGHPDEVAAALQADCLLPYATDLIFQFSPALPPLDKALRMLEQIATQIAPQLGWRPGDR